MSDRVETWLAAAGLQRLNAAFRAQEIEYEHLTELTEPELRELGLTIGERKRFHRALQVEAATMPPPRVEPVTLAERRPLTLMFVDLVNSTSLGERLDPEDLLEVIRLYRQSASGAIERYGGHIARLVGDGILAYFCYPTAHENDTERAIRAALDIVAAVGGLSTPARRPLQVRIGIATGRVIISDLLSGGSADMRTVTGSTPNLAARLQSLAPPNGIVVSELTHERVQSLFVSVDLGKQDLKGFTVPQHVFQLLRAVQDGAAPIRRSTRLTPLFGREAELLALSEQWKSAQSGVGRFAVITGEAGIGKSRLVERFLDTLSGADATIVRLSSSAFDQNSPLRPLLTYLRSTAGIDPEDMPGVKQAKLAVIFRGPDTPERLSVISDLLRIQSPPQLSDASPTQLRELSLQALLDHFVALAQERPLCVVAEDLHWLDPTSRDLLARLAAAAAERAILVLATSREDADAALFAGSSDAAAADLDDAEAPLHLALHTLDRDDVLSMVQSLFGDQPVPASVAQQIAAKTDGVPLLIEEFIRPLLKSKVHVDWSRMALGEGEGSAVPVSLQDMLMARLDQSGPAKELAQIGAVIGRMSRRGLLAVVSQLSEEELADGLTALSDAGVMFAHTQDGHDCYSFSHALVRDAAYDSLLRQRRRELHARVADALFEFDEESVESQPELLALHLTEAGAVERAFPYWLLAAQRSLRRSALLEAASLLRRGLAAVDATPATAERTERRLQLMSLLGPVLIALRGPGSPEAQAHYNDAYELAQAEEESGSHFPVLWGWWRLSQDFHTMRDRASVLLSQARKRADPERILQAHHCNWASEYNAGDLCGCLDHISAGMAVYAENDFRHHAALYGNHDARVCAHGELAQVYWMQGKLRQATAEEAQSFAWAETLGHLGSRIHAMDMALLHRSYRQEHASVSSLADELLAFTGQHGLADHRAKAMIFHGWAAAAGGNAASGLEVLVSGLSRQREIGTLEDFPIYVCLHAEALIAAGRADAAVDELQRARAQFDELGLRIWLPEVLRSLGAAMLLADPASTAKAAGVFREAAALAAKQGAAMLDLRIAASEAELALRMGRAAWGYNRLLKAMAAVPEGKCSLEWRRASELLARFDARLVHSKLDKA
jgi:predicted ATPase/class 3 adenylate cyclase